MGSITPSNVTLPVLLLNNGLPYHQKPHFVCWLMAGIASVLLTSSSHSRGRTHAYVHTHTCALTHTHTHTQELERKLVKLAKAMDHLERAHREEEAPLINQAAHERIVSASSGKLDSKACVLVEGVIMRWWKPEMDT
eukprot:1161425-Pelagomonas_calceolata.AAC.14